MQFESLSIKKQDIYLRNRYLHQYYNMILENIQQLHNNNIRLSKQNELLINRCINIDYNGKYINYDENRLNGNLNHENICNDNSFSKMENDPKKINFERVSSTLESIISGKPIYDESEDEEYHEEYEEYEKEEDDNKQTATNIVNESNKSKELNNNESNFDEFNNNDDNSNIKTSDELNMSSEELLEQTKIDDVFSNDNNDEGNDNNYNKNSCSDSKNSLNISEISLINTENLENNVSPLCLNNTETVINNENLLNENNDLQEHQDKNSENNIVIEEENEEEVVENLIRNEGNI